MAHYITDKDGNLIEVAGNFKEPNINTAIANFQKQIDNNINNINTNMLGAPSNRYIDISGRFTAPANGYIVFKGVASASHAQFVMTPNDGYPGFEYVLGYQGYGQIIYLPVKKGVTYNVATLNVDTSHSWGYYIRFYYAEEV